MLYALAYKPVLRILEARRQQIAAGLANAEKIKAELDRIEAERIRILEKAGAEGKQLVGEARAAAASGSGRPSAEGRRSRADRRQGARRSPGGNVRMLGELRREVGQLVIQTTAGDRQGS